MPKKSSSFLKKIISNSQGFFSNEHLYKETFEQHKNNQIKKQVRQLTITNASGSKLHRVIKASTAAGF